MDKVNKKLYLLKDELRILNKELYEINLSTILGQEKFKYKLSQIELVISAIKQINDDLITYK